MVLIDRNRPREVAVDVPDTFIARKKTPPRYPPPLPGQQMEMKPLLPPREYGFAPSLPSRSSSTTITSTSTVPMETIKKYEEQLKTRKIEEDQKAAETEFLNRSLRGSKKLRALEATSNGISNDAFDDEEKDDQSLSSVSSSSFSIQETDQAEPIYTSFGKFRNSNFHHNTSQGQKPRVQISSKNGLDLKDNIKIYLFVELRKYFFVIEIQNTKIIQKKYVFKLKSSYFDHQTQNFSFGIFVPNSTSNK